MTPRRSALRRGRRTTRLVMGFAVTTNILNLVVIQEPGTWPWRLGILCCVFVLVCWGLAERGWRVITRELRAYQWRIAEKSGDPVAAMARMTYIEGLTGRESEELRAYLEAHDGRIEPVPLEELPPVVRGLVLAVFDAPHEPPAWDR